MQEQVFYDRSKEKVNINEVKTLHDKGHLNITLGGCMSVIIGVKKQTELIVLASHFKPNRQGASLHIDALKQAIIELGDQKEILWAEAVYIGHGMSIFPCGLSDPQMLLMPGFYDAINARLAKALPLQSAIKCITYHLISSALNVDVEVHDGVDINTSQGDHLHLC